MKITLDAGCKFGTWMRHPVPGTEIEEQPYTRSHLGISFLDSSPSRMMVVPSLSLTGYFPKARIAVIKGVLVRTSLFFYPDSGLRSDEHEDRL